MPSGLCTETAVGANGHVFGVGLPASARARASAVGALPAARALLLSAVAARDVSSRVRSAAAGNDALPLSALRLLAADRSPTVRAKAYVALGARGDGAFLAAALSLETDPKLLVLCLRGADAGPAAIELLEHTDADVRAAALSAVPAEDALRLVADADEGVRAAARRRLSCEGLRLDDASVAAAAAGPGFLALVRGAKLTSLPAFARAVTLLERAVLHSPALEAAEAQEALGEVVRAHVRFARALDLARFPEDRLMPAFGNAPHPRV